MRRSSLVIAVVQVVMVLSAAVWAVAIPRTSNNNGTTAAPDQPVNPTLNTVKSNTTTTHGNLTVDYIDVGQGDSELIETPDNKTILIDTGPSTAQSTEISFIRSHTWGKIDDLVLTHPDADHIGNAVAVMNSFTIKAIYHSGYVDTTQTYKDFMTKVGEESCPVYINAKMHAGDYMNWSSSLTVRVMAINAHAADPNDASIVLRMTDGTVSYLFEGDASSTVESQMVTTYGTSIEAQILKVGHHGSSYSSSDSFLSEVAPKIGVIEVGAGNSYGHPTTETLARLAAHGVNVYRTDLNGTVEISCDGNAYTVSVSRS
jgi:competence protein ComEC